MLSSFKYNSNASKHTKSFPQTTTLFLKSFIKLQDETSIWTNTPPPPPNKTNKQKKKHVTLICFT